MYFFTSLINLYTLSHTNWKCMCVRLMPMMKWRWENSVVKMAHHWNRIETILFHSKFTRLHMNAIRMKNNKASFSSISIKFPMVFSDFTEFLDGQTFGPFCVLVYYLISCLLYFVRDSFSCSVSEFRHFFYFSTLCVYEYNKHTAECKSFHKHTLELFFLSLSTYLLPLSTSLPLSFNMFLLMKT